MIREAMFLLAQQSGWGLTELLNLEENDLLEWLNVSRDIARKYLDE